ncbi:40S ribosomal protein S15-like protein [Cricetulus griseus]|uniref:40S ribosomal protein S15 n=1 Tax=Cricetulus griseus TaxID=10029 RepID=A0A061IAI1_CRIGR|nr:40S ribosomal protein S15-like protein [Cricetulus griseus]
MIILPKMVSIIVGVYNGKIFNQVEFTLEMTGHNVGEFSITYKPFSMVFLASVPPTSPDSSPSSNCGQ